MATLTTNTLTGTSTAASIAVTAAGNSTTTNLQQGLCKVFISMDAGQTINDSFNVSSISDEATGAHTINFDNNFAHIRHVPTMSAKESTASSHGSAGADRIVGPSRVAPSSGLLKITSINLSNSLTDLAEIAVSIHGDLA